MSARNNKLAKIVLVALLLMLLIPLLLVFTSVFGDLGASGATP